MGQRPEERRLAEAHAARIGAEVQLGRRGDAGRSLTEGHPVQVLLENGLLVEVGVEPKRPEHLAQLARERARCAAQQAGELHGDRRAAGHHRASPEIVAQGARQGAEIDAAVVVEAAVFDGEERL